MELRNGFLSDNNVGSRPQPKILARGIVDNWNAPLDAQEATQTDGGTVDAAADGETGQRCSPEQRTQLANYFASHPDICPAEKRCQSTSLQSRGGADDEPRTHAGTKTLHQPTQTLASIT